MLTEKKNAVFQELSTLRLRQKGLKRCFRGRESEIRLGKRSKTQYGIESMEKQSDLHVGF